jgi:hypothetical protein
MKQKSNLFKTLGIMLLFVLFATQANAQNITVTGTVSDNLGPVIGASIQVEGTSNGCITDIDGNYTLPNVPSNATLVFSYIGYQTQKIAVAGKTHINVTLSEDSQLLQEVVVVGYGILGIKPYNMGIFYEHTRNPVYCGRNDKFIVEAYVLSIRPDFAIEVRATFRT